MHIDVQRTASGGTVILPMDPYFVPITWRMNAVGAVFTPAVLLLITLWEVGVFIYRSMYGIQAPPRALFEIDGTKFRMQVIDYETGGLKIHEFDRDAILELRKNQYGQGLWIHVRGVSMDTYLQDIDDQTIEALVSAVWSILKPQVSTPLVAQAATVA